MKHERNQVPSQRGTHSKMQLAPSTLAPGMTPEGSSDPMITGHVLICFSSNPVRDAQARSDHTHLTREKLDTRGQRDSPQVRGRAQGRAWGLLIRSLFWRPQTPAGVG